MGGVRKKVRVPIKKESRYKIPTKFNCPVCGQQACVTVQIKRAEERAIVYCKGECKSEDEFPVLRLEEPVDVFFKHYENCIKRNPEHVDEHKGAVRAQDPLTLITEQTFNEYSDDDEDAGRLEFEDYPEED